MNADRTVVVTGTSRGLGLCLAEQLLDAGYRVVGAARTRTPEYEALQARHPERAEHLTLDLADVASIYPFSRDLLARFGPPYALVNNAAEGRDGLLSTFHEKDIERIVATNLTAPILLTKYLSRSMLARREGRVVTISSIAAHTGFSGLSTYAATKAGLEGFTRALSRELGRRDITVNCVAPGFMEAQMTSGLSESGREAVRRRSPLGLATPADVAPAVLYLLSDAASMVTGTTVVVDGGSTA